MTTLVPLSAKDELAAAASRPAPGTGLVQKRTKRLVQNNTSGMITTNLNSATTMVLSKRTTSPSNPLALLTTPGPGKTAAKYRRRDAIFAQGDPAHAIHYVQDGKIKLTVVSPHGKEAVIAVLGPGTFLGARNA